MDSVLIFLLQICKDCSTRLPFLSKLHTTESDAGEGTICFSSLDDFKEGPYLLVDGFRQRMCRCSECMVSSFHEVFDVVLLTMFRPFFRLFMSVLAASFSLMSMTILNCSLRKTLKRQRARRSRMRRR